jgi:hypothetical protein
MDSPIPWIAIILGLSTLGAIIAAGLTLSRMRAAALPMTHEGLVEFHSMPWSPLQKSASAGLAIGSTLIAGILWIFHSNGGAAGYDTNPSMRMQILGLFMVSIANFTVFTVLARKSADERDQAVLGWAPQVQAISVLLLVAAWCVTLPVRFHSEGSVPTIYFYLISGSAWLVYMLTYFAGVILGSWVAPRHGQR